MGYDMDGASVGGLVPLRIKSSGVENDARCFKISYVLPSESRLYTFRELQNVFTVKMVPFSSWYAEQQRIQKMGGKILKVELASGGQMRSVSHAVLLLDALRYVNESNGVNFVIVRSVVCISLTFDHFVLLHVFFFQLRSVETREVARIRLLCTGVVVLGLQCGVPVRFLVFKSEFFLSFLRHCLYVLGHYNACVSF